MSNEDFRDIMKKQLPKTTRNVLAETIRNEVKKILREMDEASSSLSPEAQKALEQSKIAKQNKDAQKKRAAAKQSMRGMSVESADPTADDYEDFDFETGMWTTADEDEGSTYFPYDDEDDSENPYRKGPSRTNDVEYYTEQRIEGDKRQSDEMDFFDTDEFKDEPSEEDELRDRIEYLQSMYQENGRTFDVEAYLKKIKNDKKLREQTMFDDSDELHLERDHDDKWDDQFGFDASEFYDGEYTEEDALRDAIEAEEEDGIFTDPTTGVKTDHSFHGKW